jgi:hypothetical protein
MRALLLPTPAAARCAAPAACASQRRRAPAAARCAPGTEPQSHGAAPQRNARRLRSVRVCGVRAGAVGAGAATAATRDLADRLHLLQRCVSARGSRLFTQTAFALTRALLRPRRHPCCARSQADAGVGGRAGLRGRCALPRRARVAAFGVATERTGIASHAGAAAQRVVRRASRGSTRVGRTRRCRGRAAGRVCASRPGRASARGSRGGLCVPALWI